MARSKISRTRKALAKMIVDTKDFPAWERELLQDGEVKRIRNDNGQDAPPHKVGKQFPYENARRAGKTHPGRLERVLPNGVREILKEG